VTPAAIHLTSVVYTSSGHLLQRRQAERTKAEHQQKTGNPCLQPLSHFWKPWRPPLAFSSMITARKASAPEKQSFSDR